MRKLALDVGTKRIGIAVSDELGISAHPKEPVHRSNLEKDIEALRGLIDAFQIDEIIVGYPIQMDGSVGTQAQYVIDFVDKLKESLQVPVTMWDERLSSMAVERAMLEGDLTRKKRKKRIDSLSAQWILQGYLESKRKN